MTNKFTLWSSTIKMVMKSTPYVKKSISRKLLNFHYTGKAG
ncbi:hypothetical protein B4099_2591 [Heyndrickxia coagulans]|uniref:Uncharacterized protein n=1 Tax=Heyndrickxia coagulans TaxID=1398 RepID=A0A150JNV4_HEYCO|nr:hypothetical protein B4099_2591 [Heyndrickxia coagulans]